MPRKSFAKKKSRAVARKRVDKAQNARLKNLESFVYKTIENKQVNRAASATNVTTSGYQFGEFLTLNVGPNDGASPGDPARIGNSVSLMKQQFNIGLEASSTDTYNRMRLIIVEGLENQSISLSDILLYHNYSTHGELVFTSPYTTKTATSKRYKIYYDKVMELNRNAKGATRDIKHVIKYREGGSPGKVINFDGPTASVPANHNVRILAISDSVSASHPTICWNVRSTYKDA